MSVLLQETAHTPVHLRSPELRGADTHFPPDQGVDLLRLPIVGNRLDRILRSRKFQFLIILPNQIVFWAVIIGGFVSGLSGTQEFGTAITWYVWFCLVFLVTVGAGRAWCAMCPFGGAAEWVQRLTFWRRGRRPIGLNRRWPESFARYGLLPSVGALLLLTWYEEYNNIAGPGRPILTAIMVSLIVGGALTMFLVFERRTFCVYLCPLSALIGTVGATSTIAGFRARDRSICLSCPTKDCMRGSENGYGCPWYEWPGSATSNLMCGLCTECIKNCPYDNVAPFAQPPLRSVIAPARRRVDVAWAVAILLGLVVFQQFNALGRYANWDGWLNGHLKALPLLGAYPNPVDFVGLIGLAVAAITGYVWLTRRGLATRPAAPGRDRFSTWLMPLMYGLIPLVAADYLARQLPKFLLHAPLVVSALSDPFGVGWNLFGTAHWHLDNTHIVGSTSAIVLVQLIVVGLGTAAALYATARIVRADLRGLTRHVPALIATSSAFILAAAAGVSWLYVVIQAAE